MALPKKIEKVTKRTFIFDSGASDHISSNREAFTNFKSIPLHPISIADNRILRAVGKGDITISIPNGKLSTQIILRNVLYSPDIAFTLISLSKADKGGYSTLIKNGKMELLDRKTDQTIGQVSQINGIWRFDQADEAGNQSTALVAMTLHDLHRSMAHVSSAALLKLVKENKITGIELTDDSEEFCETCVQAKIKRAPFPKEREQVDLAFGDVFHSDVWGPARVTSLGGNRYWSTFIDQGKRWGFLEPMKAKSQTMKNYQNLDNLVETQNNKRIKALQTDRGGEYMSKDFDEYLKSRGTRRLLTVHDSPASNGIAERCNGIIASHIRAMLIESGLPKFLWAEAAVHAMWIRNRTATKHLDYSTPYQARYGKPPNLKNVKPWGSRIWVKLTHPGKLNPQSREGRFIGFDSQSKGCRVYWPDTKSISVERDIIFEPIHSENVVIIPDFSPSKVLTPKSTPITTTSIIPTPPVTTPPKLPVQSTSAADEEEEREVARDLIEEAPSPIGKIPELRRSTRVKKPSDYIKRLAAGEGTKEGEGSEKALLGYVEDGKEDWKDLSNPSFALATMNTPFGEPNTIQEAQKRDDWERWKEAVTEEIGRLESFGTWQLVKRPTNTNIVGCRWVFREKHDAEGKVAKYRARIVARGFTQEFGVDYEETFAPVAKLPSIRAVIALAIQHSWELHQMDVKSAYLNGDLDKTIYMEIPPGYNPPNSEGKVCRLLKSLYGLKQAGRQWYKKLSETFFSIDFTRSQVDHAVFYKRDYTGITIICCSTDDLTMATSSPDRMIETRSLLKKKFEMTDAGELHWMLGIKVERDKKQRIGTLSQTAYIERIIEKFGMQDSKPLVVPLTIGQKLSKSQCPVTQEERQEMQTIPYRELIGSLMYAALGTRPDICFAVTFLSQFLQNPGQAHWREAKRVIRYLKGTKEKKLVYCNQNRPLDNFKLEGFADASWGNDEDDRHSISGYVFTKYGGAISWSSKKQHIVALSSTEAEYIALTHATKEAIWLRTLLSEIYDDHYSEMSIPLYSDSSGALAMVRNSAFHSRTKHIAIRYHFIREAFTDNLIDLRYLQTEDMPADAFTKPLTRARLDHLLTFMGVSNL